MKRPKITSLGKAIIAILLCETVGITSGLLSAAGMNGWFDTLSKPSWNPPGWLFGPVWTVLYFMMGLALWLVWKSEKPAPQKLKAMKIFALQLFLNFWWSLIFFHFHAPGLAFLEILLLAVTITVTIFQFAPISRTAAWLLVPYLSWVCFASILNYTIWAMNR